MSLHMRRKSMQKDVHTLNGEGAVAAWPSSTSDSKVKLLGLSNDDLEPSNREFSVRVLHSSPMILFCLKMVMNMRIRRVLKNCSVGAVTIQYFLKISSPLVSFLLRCLTQTQSYHSTPF